MRDKGQKSIDRLMADFLPEADKSLEVLPKRKRRDLTLKQKRLVQAYTDIDNPKTFGNKRQSAFVAYDIPLGNGNLAGQIGHQQLNNPNVINYLEKHCEKMGIGVEVRLDKLRDIIRGEGHQTTITRHKTVNSSTGRLKLTSVQETDNPPRMHDRITAIRELNNMTGFYKQQEIDKQIALSEVNAMYDKIVGTGKGSRG